MMNSLLIVVIMVFTRSTEISTLQVEVNEELDAYWEEFKTIYKKQYENDLEIARRLIWESNLEYIQRHNLEYDLGKYSYSLGINQFGDLTHEEFQNLYLSKKSGRLNITVSSFLTPLNMHTFPDSVDWRSQGYVTPIKDQASCGASWSFAAAGAMEGQHFRRSGQLVNLSVQQLIDCSRAYDNKGCEQGSPEMAYAYIKDIGIEKDEDYPYRAREGHCHREDSKVVTKVACFVTISSEDKLLEAVATVGPLSVIVDANHRSFQFYKDGVYDEPDCSSYDEDLNQCALVVGYGSQDGKEYWIVKNSWGRSWGREGYILMSRNQQNQCGIASLAGYPSL